MNHPRHRAGFTLLEIVIALGIFGIMSITVITIFMTTGREERRGVKHQQGVASARFILESMAKDIRLGSIDYAGYATDELFTPPSGPLKPVTKLKLRLADGSPYFYRCVFNGATHPTFPPITGMADCTLRPLLISLGYTAGPGEIQTSTSDSSNDIDWTRLSVEDVSVSTFAIYIEPGADPYSPLATSRIQPRVTISMTIEAASGNEPKTPTLIQTTVTPRRYAPPAI